MNESTQPNEQPPCETCLERGRERPADVVTEDLAMCFDCFGGKPFCAAETVGGDDAARRVRQRRYNEKHHALLREKRREWRRKNAEHIRDYQRRNRQQRKEEELENGGGRTIYGSNTQHLD
jgi:hypothetical protein